MKRRDFLWLLGASLCASSGIQASGRPLIAVLVGGSEASSKVYRAAFDGALAELGYLDGGNIDVVRYFSNGDCCVLPKRLTMPFGATLQ